MIEKLKIYPQIRLEYIFSQNGIILNKETHDNLKIKTHNRLHFIYLQSHKIYPFIKVCPINTQRKTAFPTPI